MPLLRRDAGQGEDGTGAVTRGGRRAGGDRRDGGRPGLGVHALDPPLAVAASRLPPDRATVALARWVAKAVVGTPLGITVPVAIREPSSTAGPGHRGAAQP